MKPQPVLFLAAFFYLGGVFTLLGLTIQDYVGETVSGETRRMNNCIIDTYL